MRPRARGISRRALAGTMILALAIVAATAFAAADTVQAKRLIRVQTKMSLLAVPDSPGVTRYSGAVKVAKISKVKPKKTPKKAKNKAKKFCRKYLEGNRSVLDPILVHLWSGHPDVEHATFVATASLGFGLPTSRQNEFSFLSGTLPGLIRATVSLAEKGKVKVKGKKWRAFCDDPENLGSFTN